MGRIRMTGLEAGHMDVFDSYNGATVSVAQARTGAYSLCIDSFSEWASMTFPASKTEIFGRFGFRPTYVAMVVGANGNEVLTLYDSVGGLQITIQLQYPINTLIVRRGAHDGEVLGTGGILHQDRWHCIEFRLVVDNAAGVFQLKVDGTLVIDLAGIDTQATGNANVLSFRIGEQTGKPAEGYFDDIAFNDTVGAVNNSWIGRGGIPAIFPEGAGTYTQLTANVGPNWDDVDERPPDEDVTYVYHDTIDREDSYATEDLVNTGTISAVQWLARAKSDFAGVPEIARLLRIGGVDHSGADIAIDADYDYYPEILDEDPQAVGPWLFAAINGMEIGVTVR